jgi:uncharacterized OB-fold protein
MEIPKPYPALTAENEFFWTSGEDGELRFQRCNACSQYLHPPTPYCPLCLSNDIGVEAVSGHATIATFSVNHHQWHPAFPPPYVVAMVEIAEAPYVRLTTRIVNCELDEVRVGQPVRVLFEQVGPAWLPLFEPDPNS